MYINFIRVLQILMLIFRNTEHISVKFVILKHSFSVKPISLLICPVQLKSCFTWRSYGN